MKQAVKNLMYTIAPKWTTELLSARARAHSQRAIASWGSARVTQKLLERFGDRVQSGPFAGLTLTRMTHAEQIGPFLLGVYESELDKAWDLVLEGSYSHIIDIGAKFGYYAVGLARRFPNTRVIAYDTDRWARKAMLEMSAENGTANLEVRSYCPPDVATQLSGEPAFYISDCEGYESALFRPEMIPHLRSATLIIESHDDLVPGVSARLRSAFAESHAILVLTTEGPRRVPDQPLPFLSEPEHSLATQEVRPPQTWLVCLPKTGPNQGLHVLDGAACKAEVA